MKIVINKCYGGFSLSKEALDMIKRIKNVDSINEYEIERNDKDLIYVVESLGKNAETRYSRLSIVEIPDDVEWEINDCDGVECIREKSRTWE